MKKIIAMLLCVVLVASMGIAAFAEVKATPGSTIQEYLEALQKEKDSETKTQLEAIAATLSDAKKEVAKAQKEAKAILTAAQDAVKAEAQWALANAYYEAAAQYEAEVTLAIAQFIFDYYGD